jgi:hypothetical protein
VFASSKPHGPTEVDLKNGSLEKYLFDMPKTILIWGQRSSIVKGYMRSGNKLLYIEISRHAKKSHTGFGV